MTSFIGQLLDRRDLPTAVRELAKARADLEQWLEQKAQIQADVDKLIEERFGADLRRTQAEIDRAQADHDAADAAVRSIAVRKFDGENKDPLGNGTVQIAVYTTLDYDAQQALNYCLVHWPDCVKLDKRKFEKAAKVLQPDFVTIGEDPRAKIAKDLSRYLGGNKS